MAGALLANGELEWRTTRTGGQRRGLFCGIGTCFDCLVELNGEKAVRACLMALKEGDEVGTFAGLASAGNGSGGSGGDSAVGSRGDGSLSNGGTPGGPGLSGSRNLTVVDVVVVGAGPAGMAAAASAASRGAQVVLLDAGPRLGGQFFRQPLAGEGTVTAGPAGDRLPLRFHGLVGNQRVDLRLGCEVWSASRDGAGFVVRLVGGGTGSVRSRALVLATGASELALPFPGWELPGVMTAGAAQALLKSQQVLVGRQVVVAGTGPFLLPVAAALGEKGANVVVVEAMRARSAPQALASLLEHPTKLMEARGYGSAFMRDRVRLLTGRAVIGCEGTGKVERAVIARLGRDWEPIRGSEQRVSADAVCVSYGFVPRLELARQLGARDMASPGQPGVRVAADEIMGSSVPGLFIAGELAGVAGADVAELEGELAGHGAASYLGLPDYRTALRASTGGPAVEERPRLRSASREPLRPASRVALLARALVSVLPVRADLVEGGRGRHHPRCVERPRSPKPHTLWHGLLPGTHLRAGVTAGHFGPNRPASRPGR